MGWTEWAIVCYQSDSVTSVEGFTFLVTLHIHFFEFIFMLAHLLGAAVVGDFIDAVRGHVFVQPDRQQQAHGRLDLP